MCWYASVTLPHQSGTRLSEEIKAFGSLKWGQEWQYQVECREFGNLLAAMAIENAEEA